MKELNKTYLLYAGCLLVAFFPFFCNLDAIPMQLWDESRLANHVAEMLRSKNWIITEYLGQPDMWMTKPLLMVWLQILFTKIVGINELAIRLPSALAAVGTCLCIFYLFSRKLKLPLPGIIAVFVLVTTQGYVILHGTRTGEYDSLLTFFMMA